MGESEGSSPGIPVSPFTSVGESDAESPSLSIAVLGPGLESTDSAGVEKRNQIRERLAADGHRPFFPEDEGLLIPDYPLEPLLQQEARLLSNPRVKLVIILYRLTSHGAGFEIAHFLAYPEIKSKTAILYPAEYYKPNDNLAANTVRDFRARLPYTQEHFEVCQLVDECRKWASDVQEDLRAGIVPFQL